MLNGYLATLPTDCLLNAGVLFCTKGTSYAPMGVTDGAPDFDPGVELGEIMFDNRAPSRLKGLARRVGFAPLFKGTLKEFGPVASGGQIAVLEPGVTEAIASGVTTETVKPAGALYAVGDYLVDFRWVFQRAGGGYACIYAPLAIVRKWTAKGNDKKEAAIAFEIEAIGDPVNDLSMAPYTIEIRTQLPAGIPTTPTALVAQFNALGAANAGATNLTVYQKGINQTVGSGNCSRWGDAINNAHPFVPSSGFASGAAVAVGGEIIGEGLEVPDCSLGKTILDEDTDITTVGANLIPGANLITTLGSRHEVGMTWGAFSKINVFAEALTIGEGSDVNYLRCGYLDRNSQSAIWSGSNGGLDGSASADPVTGGTPIMHMSVWAARTTGGALANQPLIRLMYGRDVPIDRFYDTNTNTALASLTAANRRWRLMWNNGGIAPNASTACHLAYNCTGRPNAAQNKLLNDYNEFLNGSSNCWTDPRANLFVEYGDSWNPQAAGIQFGENGSPVMPNTAVAVFARSGNDLKRWQFPMAHYLADLDTSKRTGRVAVMFGEYLNGGTPTDNGIAIGFIKTLNPKIHVVTYNITHTGTNSAANDPAYQNAIDANWVAWGAEALIDLRTLLWYDTYHYGDGSNSYPPGEKAIIYDGISQHPSLLGQEYMTAFHRGGAYAATAQSDIAVPFQIVPSAAFLALTAGGTGSVSWTVKNRAGTTLGGRTLTFSSLDTGIATVNSSSGLVTAVSAGRARIKAVTDLGGVGVIGVEVTASGFSDNFNRADNASTLGSPWTARTGTWGISSNQAYDVTNTSSAVATVDAGVANYTVTLSMPVAGNDDGIVISLSDASNYVRVFFEAGTWFMQKVVAGITTVLNSGAGSHVNGDTLVVTRSGTSISSTLNGSALLSATDSFNSTATNVGMTTSSGTSRLDNFSWS